MNSWWAQGIYRLGIGRVQSGGILNSPLLSLGKDYSTYIVAIDFVLILIFINNLRPLSANGRHRQQTTVD